MTDALVVQGAELLNWRRQQLLCGGRAVDLDWLLDLAAGVSWSLLQRLRIDPQRKVRLAVSLQSLELQWRRHLEEAVPLQHLVGRCPWRDLDLEVSPAALIPRQETELLLDLAVQHVGVQRVHRWADLGTGSGALAVALLGHGPMLQAAVDLSSEALSLRIASERCASGHRCTLHCGSWCSFDALVGLSGSGPQQSSLHSRQSAVRASPCREGP